VRRRLIIEAAGDTIAQRGLFGTSMRDIAQASGVSLGTVTYHFKSLQNILASVLDHEMTAFYEPILEEARRSSSGREALLTLISAFLDDSPRTRRHWVLWLDFWALAAHYDTYSAWQHDVYLRWHDDVRAVLAQGMADGTLSAKDPEQDTVEFMAMLDGLVVQTFLPDSRLTPAEARDSLRKFAERFWLSAAQGTGGA
jgi:AcrR family transcriptional regulator